MRELRIFIADDHALVRRGTRGLLQARRSWRVVGEASNGQEAVRKVRKCKPDIAILDVGMPDLDGLEAARLLRKHVPATKVIVLTMHESTVMVHRALEAGALGYVLKSDLSKHLVRAVRHVSRGRLFLTPKASELVMAAAIDDSPLKPPANLPAAKLTPREREVIRLLAEGKSNKEAAWDLGIAVRTVETHRARIMSKCDVHSTAQLVHFAIRHQLCSVPSESPGGDLAVVPPPSKQPSARRFE